MEEFDCWIQILALRGQHLNVGHRTTSSGSSKGFDGVRRLRHTNMSRLVDCLFLDVTSGNVGESW